MFSKLHIWENMYRKGFALKVIPCFISAKNPRIPYFIIFGPNAAGHIHVISESYCNGAILKI